MKRVNALNTLDVATKSLIIDGIEHLLYTAHSPLWDPDHDIITG